MNLTITLPVDAVNAILRSLGRLPYDESAPLIVAITKQANQQIEAARQAADAVPEEVAAE